MAKSAKALVHVTGLDIVLQQLKQYTKEVRTQIVAEMVKAGAKPLQASAKRHATRSVRTGALKASIGTVIREYKHDGNAVAVIGPLRGYYRGKRKVRKGQDKRGSESPSHYAHLVEFGHHQVTGGKSRDVHKLELRGTGRYYRSGKEIKRWQKTDVVKEKAKGRVVGFTPAKPFLRPALADSRSAVMAEMSRAFERATATSPNLRSWKKSA